jgi:predicted ATPase
VYAVIAGRLAQLSTGARELAGVAATIGRAFTLDVLRRAAGEDEQTVIDALEELWQRRIVREQGLDSYDFSHDKLRDVAYSEISPMQRRRLHRCVAAALLESHAASSGADPGAISGQVAAHYERAGQAAEAIHWYQQAADVAKRLLAHEEAIGHLRRGLALLATLPPTLEHERQTLTLLLALGTPLAAVKGNADVAVREVYTQALDRCHRLGDAGQTFVVQQELRICYGQRGELAIARQMAQENLALAATLGSPELLRYAHLGVAVIGHAQGELELASAHFEQAIGQVVAPAGDFDPLFFDNALQGSLRHSALTLWLLGYPAQARARMADALAQGKQAAQSIRHGMTLYFAAMLHHYCGETAALAQRAHELEALARDHGYAYLQVAGSLFVGWVQAKEGQFASGIAHMLAGLAARRASSHRLFLPYELGLLAEAHLFAGQTAAGLGAVEEALAMAAATGECVWQAELLRLRAELLLAQGATADAAQACYWQAIDVARQQGARALELRAATGLAALSVQTGRPTEAQRLLAPMYAWFTEGLDTPDLRAARALLAA